MKYLKLIHATSFSTFIIPSPEHDVHPAGHNAADDVAVVTIAVSAAAPFHLTK